MDLNLINNGLPAQKLFANPNVNILNANDVKTNTLEVKNGASFNIVDRTYDIYEIPPTITVGATPLVLTTAAFPSGVTILDIGTTGTVTCPSSLAIDAALGTTTNGHVIWQDIINRNNVIVQTLIPPDAGPAQGIPKATGAGVAVTTRFWFTRIAGTWTAVNN